jgi:triosephosphate isomerase
MNAPSTPLVAGNWKMYKDRRSAIATARALRELLHDADGREVCVFPAFPFLAEVGDVLAGSTIGLGAQDLYPGKEGAFTGEVSGWMLQSVGCRYVLVGHSERRHVLLESDELVARKLAAALESGLEPILCVGEKIEERDAGATEAVIERQLASALRGLGPDARVTIAYEPVWAIGTGRNATPAQASEVHAWIRRWCAERGIAERPCILYGGSVKPDNIDSLMSEPEIDGVLVGGASLEPASFTRIVDYRKS